MAGPNERKRGKKEGAGPNRGPQLNLRLAPAESDRVRRAAARVGRSVPAWAKGVVLAAAEPEGGQATDLAVIEARLAWIGSCLQSYADGRVMPRVSGEVELSAGEAIAELKILLRELSSRRHGIPEGNA
jgi:hypothetical protein